MSDETSKIKSITYSEMEAAAKIGVSARTLLRLRQSNQIPFCRFGTAIRYTQQQIDQILEIYTVKPTARIKELNYKIS